MSLKILLDGTVGSPDTEAGLVILTVVPQNLCSNYGEKIEVLPCTVPVRQGGSLNIRRAENILEMLMEERWLVPMTTFHDVLLQN
ncbi:hypothetical protein TNCV_1731981 [Trichonephila clavipes]|nr:hypothetical protein TNCV_1731981 [Trichonephila clavipes]